VDDEIVSDSLEILLGDWQRQGMLAIDDVTRIAEKRRLSPEQLHAVLVGLKAHGVVAVDDTVGRSQDDAHAPAKRKDRRLSRADEIRLANSIRVGRGLEAAGDTNAELIDRGHRARDEFIRGNMRLVHWIAQKWSGLDYDDRVQEGMKGLIKAVEMFDPDLGYAFSTYATWWIRQAISRAIDDTANEIRVPVHRLQQIRRLKALARRLQLEHGREPTIQHLAAALDWTIEKTAFIADLATFRTIEIDAPLHPGSALSIKDGLADLRMPSPEEHAIDRSLIEVLDCMLSELPERTRYIIQQRFGIGTGVERTLEDIGQEQGVTRERIRQIQAKGLRKLAHPMRQKVLAPFREQGR
jgi:RNA polymerase primary sigma factor